MQKIKFSQLKSILFLLLVSAVSLNSMAAWVAQEKIQGIYYNLDISNKTAQVSYKNKKDYSGNIVIPQKIHFKNVTYDVTSIGEWAFSGCLGLNSVVIPNSIAVIGNYAFEDCSSLTTIEIPNSVTSIGEGAFLGCRRLASITLPNSVTSIEASTFWGCGVLKNISIPNSVTSIGNYAFKDCNGLLQITIPNSVTSIGIGCFFSCISLQNVTVPNSVTSIGERAFENCYTLTNITIPGSLVSIEKGTFYNCRNLQKMIVPNSVTSIGDRAFENCLSLSNLTLPNSITSIGEKAFANCRKLMSLRVPFSIKNIGKEAFASNTKLEFPENARSLAYTFPSHVISYYSLQPMSWEDVNKKMLTWDAFYQKHKKETLTFNSIDEIETQINNMISAWQTKDEFESTAEWKERVNETTRKQKAEELSKKYLEIYRNETKKINEEQTLLAKEYEKYKENLLSEYYNLRLFSAEKDFKNLKFELKPYDADNASFMISTSKYGDILLPVPRDEARSFKDNWRIIVQNMQPTFVPDGKDVALNKIVFKNGNNSYVYDSHTEANYSVTDIKYNFQPIQIAEISEKDLNISTPAPASNLDSKVISNSASDVLTVQNVTPGRTEIAASTRSDVDYSIPKSPTDNKTNTFAIIIANENYNSVSKVPYAAKDGEILEKYLTQAVGLPKDHVKFYKNASFGNMAAAMKHAENLSEAFGSDLNLIFYYAGHGMPNEKTKNPMLIPVDGDAAIPETCRDLGEIIATLGGLNAGSVVVMLDACFSGTERGDGMLMAARGIRIRSNQTEPMGNMVIISASQGDETAYPYDAEQHGLFTYFLLRKLQENKGDVTLGELADYITEQVKRQSVVSNGKLQTPTVSVSPSFQSAWRSAKLK